jgi:hypothetical protein
MDQIDIYGNHTRDIPGINTCRTLKARQDYLNIKLQKNMEIEKKKNSHFIREIRVLEQTMNFIQWIINNSSKKTVQKMIEEYKLDNKENMDETDKKHPGENDEENETIYGIFHERLGKNILLEVTLSKNEHITIESKKRQNDKSNWKKTAEINFTLHKLERILKRINTIEATRRHTDNAEAMPRS